MKEQKLIKELKIISVIMILLLLATFLLELLKTGIFNTQDFISITILIIFFVALKSEKIIGPIIGIILASGNLLFMILMGIINYVKLSILYGSSILITILISSIFGMAFCIAVLADSISLYKEIRRSE